MSHDETTIRQLNAKITGTVNERLGNYENSVSNRDEFRYLSKEGKAWPGGRQLVVNAMIHAFLSLKTDAARDEVVRSYLEAIGAGDVTHPLIRPLEPSEAPGHASQPDPPMKTHPRGQPSGGRQSKRRAV